MRCLQMACVCVWVGRLNWVTSLKPPPATGICSMSGKDDVSFVYFRMGSGFPFGRQGDDPTFSHSSDRLGTSVHLFLVHNICQCRCTWSTSGLQERWGKTIREISKHCCRLSLGFPVVKQTIPPSFFPVPLSSFWLWVYSVEFLLRTFYHESFHLNCSF